jgi:hypothetical protein
VLPLAENVVRAQSDSLQRQFPELHPGEPNMALTERGESAAMLRAMKELTMADRIPESEYSRYNDDRVHYFQAYEEYLREANLDARMRHLTLAFELEISNDGTAVAEDVDVLLYFPDGFELLPEERLWSSPICPEEPRRPRTTTEVFADHINNARHFEFPRLDLDRVAARAYASSFRIERTNSFNLTDHFKSIKHGIPVQLPRLYAVFSSFETASSFNCKYELRPANLPEATTGMLHFIVEKRTADIRGASPLVS